MNKEQFQGKWNEIKGKCKEQFGKLTDDDMMRISGKRDELVGCLQKRYGIMKEQAEERLCQWEKSCGCDASTSGKAMSGKAMSGTTGSNPSTG